MIRVTYVCYLHKFTSMGVIAINCVRELIKLGIDVGLVSLNTDQNPQDYPLEIQEALKKGYRDDSIGILFSYPDIYPDHLKFKVNVGYTGADSTGWYLSPRKNPWEICNECCHYMLTPSNYSKQIMQNLGVKVPIYLYPHGINLDIFKPFKRDLEIPFTYVYAGELTKRKGVQDLIETFIKIYGKNNKDYILSLRANTHMMYLESNEILELAEGSTNIHIDWKNEGQDDLVNYLNNGKIFIYPSRADWYGMIPFEALATGMPVMATSTNGYYEFLYDKIIPIKSYLADINGKHPYLLGKWNEPDKENLKLEMTNITNNYNSYSKKSYENSFKIREEFSWKKVTEQYLIPFLEKIYKEHFEPIKKNRKIIKLSSLIEENKKGER